VILSTHYVSDAKDPVLDFAVEVSADQGLRAVWNSSTDKGMLYSSNEGTGGQWERGSGDSVTVFWCLRDKTAGNRVCKVCSLHRCLLLSQRLVLFYCLVVTVFGLVLQPFVVTEFGHVLLQYVVTAFCHVVLLFVVTTFSHVLLPFVVTTFCLDLLPFVVTTFGHILLLFVVTTFGLVIIALDRFTVLCCDGLHINKTAVL